MELPKLDCDVDLDVLDFELSLEVNFGEITSKEEPNSVEKKKKHRVIHTGEKPLNVKYVRKNLLSLQI